ncbi:MAG: Dinucleotide-utilizing enzymes involved in molybdopterin and thiamine biosynthesis family 2 [Elusimicrobia bacterium]|nr:MAG: Dinucleotide-utilizing enzymes involved in molybdopterin and thiamine biosynthesis family 2 [Elusimicrobiota bacterium]
MSVPTITVEQLKERMAKGGVVVVDVREPHELDICRLNGTLHIPMGQIAERISELDPAAEILVHCRSGGRSGKVVEFLQSKGFKNVHNVAGGILAWAERIDPSMATY